MSQIIQDFPEPLVNDGMDWLQAALETWLLGSPWPSARLSRRVNSLDVRGLKRREKRDLRNSPEDVSLTDGSSLNERNVKLPDDAGVLAC